jgi:hypothetical protein
MERGRGDCRKRLWGSRRGNNLNIFFGYLGRLKVVFIFVGVLLVRLEGDEIELNRCI